MELDTNFYITSSGLQISKKLAANRLGKCETQLITRLGRFMHDMDPEGAIPGIALRGCRLYACVLGLFMESVCQPRLGPKLCSVFVLNDKPAVLF